MLRPRTGLVVVICAFGVISGACATRIPATSDTTVVEPVALATPVPEPVEPAPEPEPRPDPVALLIAESTVHFEAGRRELQEGHLDMAKLEFDRALEVLLVSEYGGRLEPRIRAHFDQLVERISAYEVTALAQGDGFAEQQAEPASIDELLTLSTFGEPPATAATTEAVAEDLQSTAHDIDIPLNDRVLSFVELFTGRLKGYLQEGLGRGARFLPMIQDVLRAEGLPLDLAYVPLVESAFKPNALSRAKARGLWQFMRDTGLENGLQYDWYVDERADPEKATIAAAKYLKTLHRMFNGDWHLALASYNGGPGRVQRAMKQARKDDFWSLSASTRYLPRETRDYVPLILAAVIVARNPAQYGIEIEPVAQPTVERVILPKATDLRRIAEWADTPVQQIQALNPELRRWTTPSLTDYELKVPEGTAELVKARLDAANPDELAALRHYAVKKGETLSSIARDLKVNRTDLAEANYLTTRSVLSPGQQLIIPRAPTLLLTAGADAPAPPAETARERDDAVVASNRAGADTVEPASAASPITYRVKRGDTLTSIARVYRTTVPVLKQWNSLRGNTIQVGQRLTVRRGSSSR